MHMQAGTGPSFKDQPIPAENSPAEHGDYTSLNFTYVKLNLLLFFRLELKLTKASLCRRNFGEEQACKL